MAQRVRVHYRVLGLPLSTILEPVDILTSKEGREFLVGYDDHGYPHMIELTKIIKTTVPPPVLKLKVEPKPCKIMRPGWNSYG